MKKNTSKILMAALALFMAVGIATGSTFAWFSLNTQVSATGMQITAQVPTQLLIKGSAAGAAYKNAISFVSSDDSAKYQSNAALTTVPAVSYKLRGDTGTKALISEADNWLKLTTEASAYVNDAGEMFGLANGANYDTWAERIADADLGSPVYYQHAAANDYDTDHATGDYIKDTFTLKLNGAPAASLDTVAVTITATTVNNVFLDADGDGVNDDGDVFVADIYKAIHIAFTWGTNGYLEFDLGSEDVEYGTSAGTAAVTLGGSTTYLNTFTQNEEEVEITVYIWYDGEDSDCKNSNAATIDTFTYDFQFDLVAGA